MRKQRRTDDTERPVGYRDLPPWMRAWIILAFCLLAGCVLTFAYIGITADPPDDDDDPSANSGHVSTVALSARDMTP